MMLSKPHTNFQRSFPNQFMYLLPPFQSTLSREKHFLVIDPLFFFSPCVSFPLSAAHYLLVSWESQSAGSAWDSLTGLLRSGGTT